MVRSSHIGNNSDNSGVEFSGRAYDVIVLFLSCYSVVFKFLSGNSIYDYMSPQREKKILLGYSAMPATHM